MRVLVVTALRVESGDGYAGANNAGWSSSVARRAHNPKVAGSNPAPATIDYSQAQVYDLGLCAVLGAVASWTG